MQWLHASCSRAFVAWRRGFGNQVGGVAGTGVVVRGVFLPMDMCLAIEVLPGV